MSENCEGCILTRNMMDAMINLFSFGSNDIILCSKCNKPIDRNVHKPTIVTQSLDDKIKNDIIDYDNVKSTEPRSNDNES